ncbi:hypothetical protein [Herbiconiux sp. YIM B11900]|uniref:hypothetical protein n=1 Tax=Herbiconiux sp. YIM B11900 TaxID=3404131 RepID=UPI003F861F72
MTIAVIGFASCASSGRKRNFNLMLKDIPNNISLLSTVGLELITKSAQNTAAWTGRVIHMRVDSV